MGLTSPGLVAVLAAGAAGMLAAVLWFWPRLAGRGSRMALARTAALGMLELTVLGLIFAVVNRSADYYSSWSDLLGADTASGAIVAGQYGASQYSAAQYSASRAIAPVTVTGSPAVRLPSRPGAVPARQHGRAGRLHGRAGRLQAVRLHGQLSGLTMPGYVYLPAGYSASRTARPLPVVTVISDQAGSLTAPYGARRLAATAAAQIAAGRLRPVIIVMVPARAGQDQGCLNVPGGVQAATFFGQDLPHAIDSAYRAASPLSRRWALLGDASGGYCALQLTLTSSGTFCAAALPPGGYSAPPGAAGYGGSRQLRSQDNLAWLIRHRPMQPVSVLFTGHGAAQPLLSLARPPMYAAAAGPVAGQLPPAAALDWLGARMSQARPAAG